MTRTYLGRYRRGTRIPVSVMTSASPDGCPTAYFYKDGSSTHVKVVSLPGRESDRVFFGLSHYLDGVFEDGHYLIVIRYTISATPTVHYRRFEVIGGDSQGNVIAINELRRTLGRAVATHREDGRIAMGYKPRIG